MATMKSRMNVVPFASFASFASFVTFVTFVWVATPGAALQPSIPTIPLTYGFFTTQFSADGSFSLKGDGWPTFAGTWKADGGQIELTTPGVRDCEPQARYSYQLDGGRLRLGVVTDTCMPRRMILDRSAWRAVGEAEAIPIRRIATRVAERLPPLPAAAAGDRQLALVPRPRGFRRRGLAAPAGSVGPEDRQNILWRTRDPRAGTLEPRRLGQSRFRDQRHQQPRRRDVQARPLRRRRCLGRSLAAQVDDLCARQANRTHRMGARRPRGPARRHPAHQVDVCQRDARHRWPNGGRRRSGRKASTPTTSKAISGGRPILATSRSAPTTFPASNGGRPARRFLWEDLVILQVDTHLDSFLIALDPRPGRSVWKTDRDELPSWGTPTVVTTPAGPELVTNASKYIRGYDPRTGKELWRLGGSSKITAPTPIFSEGLFVVASGRAPERPIFVVKPGARGDLTLKDGAASSDAVVWSRTGRGSYMPTPLAYRGLLYVLANNGVFDAYDLKSGAEVYRQRLPVVGSGYSASPVAADGKIYLSSEDGEMLVVAAGREFKHLATNAMGELLMATPALSEGVMFVRAAESVFAVGRKP